MARSIFLALTISISADAGNAQQQVQQFASQLTRAFGDMQSKMTEASRTSTQASESWQRSLQGLSAQVVRQTVEQGNLAKAFLQTGQVARTQRNEFQRLEDQYKQTSEASADLTRQSAQLTRVFSTFRQTLGALGVSVGVAGFVALARSIVEAGLEFERFHRTLQATVGTAAGAQRAMAFIVAESNRLGQSLQTMVPMFVQLTAATRNTVLEGEKTRALFSALAGAGQAVGLSTEAVGRAMTGLIQIISQNAIQLDEFRNQFASQIPGAMRETAKALGEMGVIARGSVGEMLEAFEKGQVPIEALMEAVTTGLQRIQEAAPPMADSVEAAFNQLSNAIKQFQADLAASGLLELLGQIARVLGREIAGAGRALGLVKPSDIKALADARQELEALIKLRDEAAATAADPSRLQTLQGLLGFETASQQVANYNKQIAETVTRIATLEAHITELQSAEQARELGRQRAVEQEKADNKAFDDERKARDAQIKARPSVLAAEGEATAARLKSNLEAIKRHYAEQRTFAEQFAQEQLREAPQEAAAIAQARADAIRQIEQREALALLAARKSLADQELKQQQAVLNAQLAAAGDNQEKILALRAKEPALVAEHAAKIADITAERAALEARWAERTTEVQTKELEKRLKEEERFTELQQEVRSRYNEWLLSEAARLAREHERLDQEEARNRSRLLEQQRRDYERFVERVTSSIADIFQDLLNGTLNVLETFKQLFLRTIAQIAAEVLTKEIVVPVIISVVGGLGGAAGLGGVLGSALGMTTGGAAESAGGTGIFEMLGLASLFGPQGLLGEAIAGLTSMLDQTAITIGDWVADTFGLIPTGEYTDVSGLGALGGVVGLLTNIYGALTADGPGSLAGSIVGALGGGAAIAASLGLVLTPIFGPIGLAVAALAPLLGKFIDSFISPAGPRLAIGGVGGLGIGGGETPESALTVTGQLTSDVIRKARTQVDTGAIQDQLAQSVTALVTGMVNAINAVATQPGLLLEPTRRAMADALAAVQPINSSNAEKMAADVAAQVQFVAVQIASFFLEPLNQAAEQLLDAEVEDQIARMGPTLQGMADVFRLMNDQLNQLSQVANTDVLRQLSEVKSRVENFGHQMVEVGRQLAEDIVAQVTTNAEAALDQVLKQSFLVRSITIPGLFQERLGAAAAIQQGINALGGQGFDLSAMEAELNKLFVSVIEDAFALIADAVNTGEFHNVINTLLAIPDAVAVLNPALAEMKALAQSFAQVLGPLDQAIAAFEDQLTSGAQKLAESTQHMQDLRDAIEDADGALNIVLPLYQQLSQEIVRNANLEIAEIQRIGAEIEDLTRQMDALQSVMDSIDALQASRQGPEGQLALLDAQMAPLEQLVAQGQADTEDLAELVNLSSQQLQALDELITAIEATLESIEQTFTEQQDVFTQLLNQWAALQGQLETINAINTTGALPPVEELQATATALQELIVSIDQLIASIEATLESIDQTMMAQLTDFEQFLTLQSQMDTQLAIMNQQQASGQMITFEQLQELTGTTQQVIQVLDQMIGAIESSLDSLEQTLNAGMSLTEQQALLQTQMNAILADIAAVGYATPDHLIELVDLFTQQLALQEQITDILEGALQSTRDTILEAISPAEQIRTTREQIAALEALVNTGQATPEQLAQLVALNQQLLQLGVENDLLAVQEEALGNLQALEPYLSDLVDQSKAAEEAIKAELINLQTQLEAYLALFTAYKDQAIAQLESITVALQTMLAGLEDLKVIALNYLTAIAQILNSYLAYYVSVEQQTLESLNTLEIYAVGQYNVLLAQQKTLQDQLLAQYGTTDVATATRIVQEKALMELGFIRSELANLFYSQQAVAGSTGATAASTKNLEQTLQPPLTMKGTHPEEAMNVRVVYMTGQQTGGWIGMAQGGRLPVMLEPGERVYPPPVPAWVPQMNMAMPRFGSGGFRVPGSGDGDSIPAWLPPGSFVLNRRASGAMGMQAGGFAVGQTGGSEHKEVTINLDLRGSQFARNVTIEELLGLLKVIRRRGLSS